MGDVAVQNPATGELRMVAEADAPSFVEQTGWTLPDQAQRERGARMLESGGVGDQALAAGETAIRTGTFGLVPGLAKGWQQRSEVQHEEHPYVEMGARAVGALAPALATSGAATALSGAAGLSAGATGLVAGAAEGLAGGAADEIEQAREEVRDASVGNIFLYGLGGEIAGRALPAALKMGAGKVRRALTAAEEITGEGVPSALAGVEARSVESEARIARDLPQGPERTAALERTAPQQYEQLAVDGAETFDKFHEQARDLASPNKRVVERIKQAMPEESPAQQNWLTEQKRALSDEYLSATGPKRAPEPVPSPAAPTAPPGPTVHDAAADYALDAAKRRLRGVADHTGNPELDALAGQVGERSPQAKALPDEVKKAINERTGKAKLEDVVSWAKDPEALRAGHGIEAARAEVPPTPGAPAAAPPVAAPLDMGSYGKDVRNVVRPGLRRMDQATSIADQYFAARDMASQLEAIGSRVAKDEKLPPSVRDGILGSIQDRAKALRSGLSDESLFGGAAKLESDLAKGAQKMNAGLDELGALSDPGKMRKFLQSDRVDRMAMSKRLDSALDGAEDLLATHEAHGTLDPKQIAEQRARISRIREARGLADEIQVAKAARPEPVTPTAGARPGGSPARGLAEMAADELVDLAPYPVRKGYQLFKLARRIKGIDDAARSATRQTARRLAGTAAPVVESAGLGKAVRKAVGEEVAAAADRVVPGASKAYQRAKEIIERQRARAGESGMVDVGARAGRQFSDDARQFAKTMTGQEPTGKPWASASDATAERSIADAFASRAMVEDTRPLAQQIEKELAPDQVGALRHYTSSEGYKEMQANLTGKTSKAAVSALDAAVDRGLVAPGETTRGVFLSAKELADLKASETFTSPGFMSTSANPRYPRRFLANKPPEVGADKIPVLLQVHQHTGVPLGFQAQESEILLRPGTRFDVKVVRDEIKKGVFEDTVHLFERPEPSGRAAELIERQRARTGTEGAVVIEGGAHPQIDKLATRLDQRLTKLRELEGTEVTGEANDLGINRAAEKHAGRLEQARNNLDESVHALRDEYHSRIGDVLEGRTPEELGPKARAKYDRFKSGLDQLEGTLAEHGATTEKVAGVDLYTLGDRAPEAAEKYLAGLKKGSTEAGYTESGVNLKGILTSPMGLTTAAGGALLAAPKAMTALERFQGDYSGPEESFLAKKKLLDQDLVAPDALFEALGASMEDLPKLSPELFQKLSARMAEKIRFVRGNLPAGIKTTMMYPNGTPPSMSALRDFATVWNTTMHPHSVLDDIDQGTATAQQMKVLQKSDPDLYEQLRGDVVEEIGTNFRNVPLSTKLQMDILFNADGIAGPFFSSKAAKHIAQANKEQMQRGPQSQPAPASLDKMSSASGPAGLGAIQSSVTNKGSGA